MVNNLASKRGYLWLLILALAFLTCLNNTASAADKFIKYLPRNEDMDSITKSYPSGTLTLREVYCRAAADLFKKAEDCNWCLQVLKPNCPDCCLVFTPNRAIRCSPQHSPDYDCQAYPLAFSCNTCTPVRCPELDNPDYCATPGIPGCQRKGCPSSEPNDSSCTPQTDGTWLCNENGLLPKFKGCKPTVAIPNYGSPCNPPSSNWQDYYTTTPTQCQYGPGQYGHGQYGHGTCYQYKPTIAFSSCIDACIAYTNASESCDKRLGCCWKDICSKEFPSQPGLINCPESVCKERLIFKDCDNYKAEDCIGFNQAAMNCLAYGNCSSCFQEVDSNFSYRFVAKSRDALTIIWQIATTPHYLETPNKYLYTKVKAFEVLPTGEERLAHESMVHQKHLGAAFSIFCATHIKKDILTQGKPYVVRIYYFLAEENPGEKNPQLYVEINSLNLIFVKIRE